MKLNLICSNKNSGGGGAVPRNTGIRIARGNYLWFIDSDDVIIENALEEFNALIEKFDADVVYCPKHYENVGEFSLNDKTSLKIITDDEVTEPSVMSDSLKERMNKFCKYKYISYSWNQLIKRDFIAENNLFFHNLRCGTDCIFGFYSLCLAKKILSVPNVWYVWRQTNIDSITKSKLPVEKLIHRWVDSLFKGVGIIDELMNEISFFREHPEYKHHVYELFIGYHAHRVVELYAQIPAWQLDGLIRRELSEVKDQTALTAFLFSRMNIFNVQLNRQNLMIRQMDAYIKQLQEQLKALQG